MNRAHGESFIMVRGKLLHHRPHGGINEAGIQEIYYHSILNRAKEMGDWVLLETPTADAGLTPESLDMLAQWYSELHQHRCQAVMLLFHNSMHRFIGNRLTAKLKLPYNISDRLEDLQPFAMEVLGEEIILD